MEGINIPYKGLRMRYSEFIIIKARRGHYTESNMWRVFIGKHFEDFVKANYKPILMEWWEFVERVHMERTLPDNRLYTIGHGRWTAQTGKKGYINFQISLHKEMIKHFEL